MTPDISEFSYGFALTNELVGWGDLSVAPVFPSLIEEGKEGGGYDVKLELPGVPLFLQFKRADFMTRNYAGEIKHSKCKLDLPYYRFPITQKKKSFQHTSLVELDDGSNLVFYAAPRFHTLKQINDAWRKGSVSARSIFVEPKRIGLIKDNERHTVAYDKSRTYFCSKAHQIKSLSAAEVAEKIGRHLSTDSNPLGEMLPGWLKSIRSIRSSAQRTQLELTTSNQASRRGGRPHEIDSTLTESAKGEEDIESQSPRVRRGDDLKGERLILRKISDEAMQGFGTQFIVVQPSERAGGA